MSAAHEELISETAAARYLGVPPQRVREFASRGLLQAVPVEGPRGREAMYYTSEVLRLKERLRRLGDGAETEEWPDVIDE